VRFAAFCKTFSFVPLFMQAYCKNLSHSLNDALCAERFFIQMRIKYLKVIQKTKKTEK